ncbi:MAG TPA: DUF2304 domain-containing protein [Bryobacteraceae bacterium]|nr:DUF2304 domain-containing protein [Bryobacteraceae bacterium]
MSPAHVGPTASARLLVFIAGLLVCGWTLHKLRRRGLLVPLGSLFLTASGILICFSAFPRVFDRLAFALGVDYPPVLYLAGLAVLLMLLTIQLAARLSVLDVRCRRLTQELALRDAARADGE